MQVYASPRLELFATSSYNRGKATISGLNYDVSRLGTSIAGLDFNLMNDSFAGFSDLRVRQVIHTGGFNYRLSDSLVLNGALEFHDYDDAQPYLFDATGRRVLTYAGLSWLF